MRAIQDVETMLVGGKTAAEVIQKLEVSEGIWTRWNSQYGGLRAKDFTCHICRLGNDPGISKSAGTEATGT